MCLEYFTNITHSLMVKYTIVSTQLQSTLLNQCNLLTVCVQFHGLCCSFSGALYAEKDECLCQDHVHRSPRTSNHLKISCHSCGQVVTGTFTMTMRLPILPVSCTVFWQNIASLRSVSPPTAQIWLPAASGFSQS
jgi:hypothetical protein